MRPRPALRSAWHTPIVDAPGQVTPAGARFIRRCLRPWSRLMHRPTLEGLAHLPPGPFLLVANHSAGIALSELASLMSLWLDAQAPPRPLAGFAHPLGLRIFPASAILRSVGAVPSTHAGAEAALARGVSLLVFPGGDHEAMRPVWQAHRVDFGGRCGFLRIARRANVPIVPLGIRGSHFTVPILWRSRHLLPWALVLPRLIGIKRWPLTLLGALGAAACLTQAPWTLPVRVLVAWAWLVSPLMCLPVVPARITFRIGRPMSPETLFAGVEGDDPAALAPAREAVEAAVQRLVARRD